MNNIVVSVHLCHSSSALMTKLIIKSTFMVFSINLFYPARHDGSSCYRYFSQICTLFLFFVFLNLPNLDTFFGNDIICVSYFIVNSITFTPQG